jgi:hypothetical protein
VLDSEGPFFISFDSPYFWLLIILLFARLFFCLLDSKDAQRVRGRHLRFARQLRRDSGSNRAPLDHAHHDPRRRVVLLLDLSVRTDIAHALFVLFQSATSPASCSHASLEYLHDYRSALAVLSSPLSRRRRRRCGRHYPAWTKKQEERKEHLRLAHLTVQDEVAAHELSIQEAKKKQSEKVRISFVEPLSPFFGLVWFAHRSFSSLRPLLPQAAAAALKASRARARAKKAGAGGKRARGGGGGKRGGGSKRARLEKEARARKRAERKASLPAAPTRIKLEQTTSELEVENCASLKVRSSFLLFAHLFLVCSSFFCLLSFCYILLFALKEMMAPSDAGDDELYCVCSGPGVGFMLACYKCDSWFHGACLGLDEDAMDHDAMEFECHTCSDVAGCPRLFPSAESAEGGEGSDGGEGARTEAAAAAEGDAAALSAEGAANGSLGAVEATTAPAAAATEARVYVMLGSRTVPVWHTKRQCIIRGEAAPTVRSSRVSLSHPFPPSSRIFLFFSVSSLLAFVCSSILSFLYSPLPRSSFPPPTHASLSLARSKVSVLFMYRYISHESCSQFDSLPLTSLTIARASPPRRVHCPAAQHAARSRPWPSILRARRCAKCSRASVRRLLSNVRRRSVPRRDSSMPTRSRARASFARFAESSASPSRESNHR